MIGGGRLRGLLVLMLLVYLGCIGLLAYRLLADTRTGVPQAATFSLAYDGERPVLLSSGAGPRLAGLSGLLLPLSPDEQGLPGLRTLWQLLDRELPPNQPVPANGFDGLQLIESPEQVAFGAQARLELGHPVEALYHHAGYLYLLKRSGLLVILDVTTPQRPVLLARERAVDNIRSMAGRGDRLYLLSMRGPVLSPQLVVLDLSRPGRPVVQTRIDLEPTAQSLALFDSFLGVYADPAGSATGRLQLYRLDPALTEEKVLDVADADYVHLPLGDNWLLADSRGGLRVEAPFLAEPAGSIAELPLPGRLHAMSRAGDSLFAWGRPSGGSGQSPGELYVIDISRPAHPELSLAIDSRLDKLSQVKAIGPCFYLFTRYGGLYVHNRQSEWLVASKHLSADIVLPRPDGDGLIAIGRAPTSGFMPGEDGSPDVTLLSWPRPVLAAAWFGDDLLLLEAGRLQSVSFLPNGEARPTDLLKLPAGVRWLVSSHDRIYLGGDELLLVAGRDQQQRWRLTRQIALPGIRSFSALPVADSLLIAAGTDGLLRYDLTDPDRPARLVSWSVPTVYASLIDVRRIAVCGPRIFAAAGAAGLLVGRLRPQGDLELDGRLPFASPVRDLLLTAGLCLVATEDKVHCIDVRRSGFLQQLATIRLAAVGRLTLLPGALWAGQTGDHTMVILPVPRILLPDVFADGREFFSLPALPMSVRYRLHLFSAASVSAPFILSDPQQIGRFAPPPVSTGSGARR
ncbi:MAG: hypothetical protein RQ723_05110 [Desulfuromonadales bacterium]|nr:hypothetical protein [Desulfuromonadales bacterium]